MVYGRDPKGSLNSFTRSDSYAYPSGVTSPSHCQADKQATGRGKHSTSGLGRKSVDNRVTIECSIGRSSGGEALKCLLPPRLAIDLINTITSPHPCQKTSSYPRSVKQAKDRGALNQKNHNSYIAQAGGGRGRQGRKTQTRRNTTLMTQH